MSRKKPSKDDGAPPPPEPHRGGLFSGLSGFVTTLAIVAAILYVSVVALSRTDGFRGLVSDALESSLGRPVKLSSAWVDLSLNLHLGELSTIETNSPHPAITAKGVVVDLSPLASLGSLSWSPAAIAAESCDVNFVMGPDGRWVDHPLSDLGGRVAGWLNVRVPKSAAKGGGVSTNSVPEVSAVPDWAERPMRISLRNGSVRWWTATQEVARLDGIRFDVTPLTVPSRKMRHYAVDVQEVSGADGFLMRGVSVEMLDAGDQQIVMKMEGAHAAGPKPFGGLDIGR